MSPRLELSKLNHELESKLSQLEQERTELKHREAALEQQAEEAGESEKKWREKVEEREREVATLQQQCVDLGTTLQAREGELTQLTEKVSGVILVSWMYFVKTTVDRCTYSLSLHTDPRPALGHTESDDGCTYIILLTVTFTTLHNGSFEVFSDAGFLDSSGNNWAAKKFFLMYRQKHHFNF